MGKIKQGILGGFSGKVGNVVGQRINGEWIMKAYQGEVRNPKTALQQKQRDIFAKAVTIMKKACPADWQFAKKLNGVAGMSAYTSVFSYILAFQMLENEGRFVYNGKPTKSGLSLASGFDYEFAGEGQESISLAGTASNQGERFVGIDFSKESNPEAKLLDLQNAEDLYLNIYFVGGNGVFTKTSEFLLTVDVNTNIPFTALPNCGAFQTPDEVGSRVRVKMVSTSEMAVYGGANVNQSNYPNKVMWAIEGKTPEGMDVVFGAGIKEVSFINGTN